MTDSDYAEKIRSDIRKVYIAVGAPLPTAMEIADLTIFAVAEAMRVMREVSERASSTQVGIAVTVNSFEIAAVQFQAMSENMVGYLVSQGLDAGEIEVGDKP